VATSPTDLEILPSGREYVQQLNNYICNVDTKKLEWLPMIETSSSFYIFTTADDSSEVERKELELWILGNIKQSNLGGRDLEDWVLDLTLEDAVSYTFDVLIATGPYQAPSKHNPNYFSTLRLKSKLKKH